MEKNLLTAEHKELTLEQIFSKLTHHSDVNRRNLHCFGVFTLLWCLFGVFRLPRVKSYEFEILAVNSLTFQYNVSRIDIVKPYNSLAL